MEYFKEVLGEFCKFIGVGMLIGMVLKHDKWFRPFMYKTNKKYCRIRLYPKTDLTREEIVKLGRSAVICSLCNRNSFLNIPGIFSDPVVAPDGRSYDRHCIEKHIEVSVYCPNSKIPIYSDSLYNNRFLKEVLNVYFAKEAN